jgi:hypothetical protein
LFSEPLVVGSAAGWISPIWWGGEALLFPVVFGVTVLAIGGVLLYLLLRSVVAVLGRQLTWQGHALAGVIIGALLMPAQRLVASLLTSIPGWEAITPMASVFIILAVAALVNAVAASLLVAFLPRASA